MPDVEVVVPDELAGSPVDVTVEGIRAGAVVATGGTTVTPVAGDTVVAVVVLVRSCSGESECTSPPAPTCVDGSTLRTYGASGVCTDGACDYPHTDTVCSEGCVDGGCVVERCTPTAGWMRQVVDDDDAARFWVDPQVAVDEVGQVHIMYFDAAAEELRYGFRPDPRLAWSTGVVEDDSVEYGPLALAVERTGAVHFCFQNQDRDLVWRYLADPESAWLREIVDGPGSSGLGSAGIGNDIAVGPDGGIHMTHIDSFGDSLRYVFRAGTSGPWSLETRADGDLAAYGVTSVAVDSTGRSHIAYQRSDQSLGYVTRDSTGEVSETEVIDPERVGDQYLSLAVDRMGSVHVSWVARGTDISTVRYARRSESGAWALEEVGPGFQTSLAVDPWGGAHLVYSGGTNLDYSFRSSPESDWSTERVFFDGPADRGTVAVDGSGGVHVAYLDPDGDEVLYSYRCHE
jgi:hypothetical protein